MIALVLLLALGVITAVARIEAHFEAKRLADARCRASMRAVSEKWHFREWERDLRSSDSV